MKNPQSHSEGPSARSRDDPTFFQDETHLHLLQMFDRHQGREQGEVLGPHEHRARREARRGHGGAPGHHPHDRRGEEQAEEGLLPESE